jgi:hypothetical protein
MLFDTESKIIALDPEILVDDIPHALRLLLQQFGDALV